MQHPSLFDIPRKPEDLLDANEGRADARYQPVSASKDVSGDEFTQGVHRFKFDTSGNTWFVPSMSYIRLRCALTQTREDGGLPLPLLVSGDVAPNMGLASNLFKALELRLNGKTLERIAERVPQVDALKIRTKNTGAWLQSLGKTTNFWAADFDTRKQQAAVDGYLNRGDMWSPCYGARLTQVEAGFHEDHLLHYHGNSHILTFDENGSGDIDIQHGPMALREGDRLGRNPHALEIVHVVDATHAYARYVATGVAGRGHISDGAVPPRGVNGWYVQRLHHARTNDSTGANEFEILWQPPLGFFEIEHGVPPGGEWMLELTPQSAFDFKRQAIETLMADARTAGYGQAALAGDVDFRVNDMKLYVYTMESNRFDKGSWLLDIEQAKCQLQHLPADCTGLVTRNFDVHPMTNKLILAFQDQNAGSDTRYSRSKFKIRPGVAGGIPGRSTLGGQDLLLERFFIQYGREQKPSPDFEGSYWSHHGNSGQGRVNHLLQRYVDSLMQADLYHTDGGAESFNEWITRGPFYYFRWPKDAMNQSARASVSVKFAQAFQNGRQHQMVLFSQWRSVFKIVHKNGRMELDEMQTF